MMRKRLRKNNRAVVLIVVVGVLAILSLLAATFGMIARVELALSRNQTENEMARQAAHDGAEALISQMASLGQTTSGPMPDFFPNSADTDGIFLYRRDGVKVYFAASSSVPLGSITPDWLLGLGCYDQGMFNLNAHGFANDLGSSGNMDIRYTSFDTSLVRLLTSRFATIPIGSSDMTALTGYDPTFNTPQEQQRIAILLNRAIINWRYGPIPAGYTMPLPGIPGTEEHRLSHLPRWNDRLGWKNADDTGVGYPGATGNKNEWGWNDNLPSLFINMFTNPPTAAPLGQPWSYAEPGVWTSYQGGGNWGNDTGMPYVGLFWGKVLSYDAGTKTLTADTNQPGWTDWPVTSPYVWNGCYVYFAAKPDNWPYPQISAGPYSANSLTLSTAPAFTLNPGDAFCICPPETSSLRVGWLNKRWDGLASDVGALVPGAMYWPNNSVLATERNVWDLMVDNYLLNAGTGKVANTGNFTQPVTASDPSLYDSTKSGIWTPGVFDNKNYVVHIYGGTGRGQVRTILSNDTSSTQLTLSAPWTNGNLPDITSQYRIEYNDDNLPSKFQPNNLQGNNRLYLSLGDLYSSVIVPALVSDGLTNTNAAAMAGILLPYFQPYLTVSTQAIQASQALCSINDWATDGMDNLGSVTVDSPAEAQYEQSLQVAGLSNANRISLARTLYNKLGLAIATWAHANPSQLATRIPQAVQLVANIIDFRDPTDVPSAFTVGSIDPTAPSPGVIIYGAKGLHVTQVMPTPDAIYSASAGTEMTDDGETPPVGIPKPPTDTYDWNWIPGNAPAPGYWQVGSVDPTSGVNPIASFTFSNLIPGYYAMRLIGQSQNTTNTVYTVSYTSPWAGAQTFYACTTTKDPDPALSAAGWYTGFVRNNPALKDGSGALACFQVPAAGTLSFTVQAPVGAQFLGFALCAQYIQITNIATHDINLAGWKVATDQTGAGATLPVITIPQTYIRAADGHTIRVDRIPGAVAGTQGFVSGSPSSVTTTTFPIRYGTYVICMCEEAYERQWGPKSTDPDFISSPPNQDGKWGDERNEVGAVYPFGDCPPGAVTATQYNNATLALLMGAKGTLTAYNPAVTVRDTAGNLIAGVQNSGAAPAPGVDGIIPPIIDSPPANCYTSIEKTVILQPTWDIASYWLPYTTSPMQLCAAQNVLVTVPPDPPRISTSTVIRCSLNRNYSALWNSGWTSVPPAPILTAPSQLADPTHNQVFPFILNRPYATTGWLGIVPTSNLPWRTIDPNPTPVLTMTQALPDSPEHLLGTLMSNATVGGVYARFNINTATVDTLKTVFCDADAALIFNTRNARANKSWPTWDDLLNDPIFQYSRNVAGTPGIGFFDCHSPVQSGDISNADAGAGTYADGFPDSSNEKKEWFMRFSNLFCLQSTSFQFTVAGLVYVDRPWDSSIMQNNEPVAVVRIEMDVDMSTGTPQIVHFRYLTQQ